MQLSGQHTFETSALRQWAGIGGVSSQDLHGQSTGPWPHSDTDCDRFNRVGVEKVGFDHVSR
jgi:hypothetical protein